MYLELGEAEASGREAARSQRHLRAQEQSFAVADLLADRVD